MCLLLRRERHCSPANALQLLRERLLVKLANNVIPPCVVMFLVRQGFYWSSRLLLVTSNFGFIRLVDSMSFPQQSFRKVLSRIYGYVLFLCITGFSLGG